MIVWQEKLKAFGVHFLVTLALAAAAAALIFLVWFPDPFQTMVGGTTLFLLVVGCDLALGPLISLVIYNSAKSRGKLLFDYTVVGAVQLAALIYGVYVVSSSRPVYIAFAKDRLEVITASEIEDSDLAAAREPEYRTRPAWGARLVGTFVPPEEHNDAVFSALAGKDISVLPKYYTGYDSQLEAIREKAQSLKALEERHPSAKPLLGEARAELSAPDERIRWLPVKHKAGFWTVLIDVGTGRPLKYLPLDPY